MKKQVIVSGGFDDIRSHDLRFLEEASKIGELTVLLWNDELLQAASGKAPKFPMAERTYFLNAARYVTRVLPVADKDAAPKDLEIGTWMDIQSNPDRAKFCEENKIDYRLVEKNVLKSFPASSTDISITAARKKVVVTGSFDWFHSGHVRFLEECSTLGGLYVIVGHDANIRLLKGEGHPLLPEEERRYVVASIKFVKQALVSTGNGWLDADPEIQRLKPDIYAVNEDGDKGGKREYCEKNGIEYVVLKRVPAPGLPKRSSTDLRGF